jgi:hypothetical protein
MMECDIAEERNRISLFERTIKQLQMDSRYEHYEYGAASSGVSREGRFKTTTCLAILEW